MDCPRCESQGRAVSDGPYRGAPEQVTPVTLVAEDHPAGVTIQRCPSCGGAFVTHDDLRSIEERGRARPYSPAEIALRGYAPAFGDIRCMACGGETNRREWRTGTLVFVDVCIECRGVWLDTNELEALSGK